MAVHSGRFGVLNGVSTVRNWSINDLSSPQRFVASNTLGGSGRRPGARDWNGSYGAYGGNPGVMPGEAFSFSGYAAPDNDTAGGVGTIWAGTAIVDSVAITWNWANQEIISHVVNFSANGALTSSASQTALSDATTVDAPAPCGTKITYGTPGSGGFGTDWENLVQAVLTITAENQTYVNTDTVVSSECWTFRKAGPIDWTLAVTEQNSDGLPTDVDIAQDEEFQILVDETDFWHLKWGHVGDASGLTVDRETGAIIERTVNIAMSGFVGGSTGNITVPGAVSDWWPFAA